MQKEFKSPDFTTIEGAAHYCEGLLNDLEAGLLDKAQAMTALGEYTQRILDARSQTKPRWVEFAKRRPQTGFYFFKGKRGQGVYAQYFAETGELMLPDDAPRNVFATEELFWLEQ